MSVGFMDNFQIKATLVANDFIDQYMISANGEYVKVYLYLPVSYTHLDVYKRQDQNGKFHLNSSGLVAYSHGEYFELGKKLGKFGYSVQKKKKTRK